ncbi:helix-turn-helix domain containing protein [Kitasatospora sp. RB6PN24]|uniref:helix-turn-helix domain-containing protein n=1 Tax=Kitasatospora humi TaxID=2893891 RepID=UPI001E4625F4|nr:helix-turn-helix domain-containing protein [Kitasatospora humi]MCC9312355.1 helix-turn-helix domain containing protein [Kitasatospora humi]
MVSVEQWSGREAVLLQAVMRESIRGFAERLGISPRTVTKWRKEGTAVVCRPEMQQILDTALATCTAEEQAAFRRRLGLGEPAADIPRQTSVPAGGRFTVVAHRFLPLYAGKACDALFAVGQPQVAGAGGLVRRALDMQHPSAGLAQLHAFDCGVTVLYLEESVEFDSVTELAVWRYHSYAADRVWAGKQLRELLSQHGCDGSSMTPPEYVLSVYELRDHGWEGSALETALQLLATPSVLVDRSGGSRVVPLGPGVEAAKFSEGWAHPEAFAFGGGVSEGVAAWSGVAYHPRPEERALTMSDIVALELDTQALWALSSHILQMVEEGLDPVMPEAFGWRWLRGALTRLTTARPLETAQHRVMREAVLATSELPGRLRAAQEALRDSNP